MPPVPWHPPAFLLPSWSEAQLALLRQARPGARLPSFTAALYSRRITNRRIINVFEERRAACGRSRGQDGILHLPQRDSEGRLANYADLHKSPGPEDAKKAPQELGDKAGPPIRLPVSDKSGSEDKDDSTRSRENGVAVLTKRDSGGYSGSHTDLCFKPGLEDADGSVKELDDQVGPTIRQYVSSKGTSEEEYNLLKAQQQIFDLLKTRNQFKRAEMVQRGATTKAENLLDLISGNSTLKTPADLHTSSGLTRNAELPPHRVTWPNERSAGTHSKASELVENHPGNPVSNNISSSLGPEGQTIEWGTTADNPVKVARTQRLSLDMLLQKWNRYGSESIDPASEAAIEPPSVEALQATEFKDYALLTFRTHDNTLDIDDFMRIAPPGKHIRRWLGHGAPVQVTPVRNADTFEANGAYLLVFRNAEEALTYRVRAGQLHRAVISASKDTLKILPGGFLEIDDDDLVYRKVDWTLISEGEPLYMRIQEPPLPAHHIELFRDKGYPELAGPEGSRRQRAVLFWVDGHRPSLKRIQDFLANDGLERGSLWTASKSIVPYTKPVLAPRRSDGEGLYAPNDEESKSEESPTDEEGLYAWEDEKSKSEGLYLDEDSASRSPTGDNFSRWILSFDDETEARRFVRTWHMRHWPHPEETHKLSHGEAPIHATLLW